MRHRAPAQFFFSEVQIQISAGQFWQHNRGNMAIRRQLLVRSARRGCQTKGLDPARRAMSYLSLTEFFLPLNDHSPPTRRRSDLLASLRPFSPHTLKCLASTNGNKSSLAILPVVCESTWKNVCFYSVLPSGIASVPGSGTTLAVVIERTVRRGTLRHVWQ